MTPAEIVAEVRLLITWTKPNHLDQIDDWVLRVQEMWREYGTTRPVLAQVHAIPSSSSRGASCSTSKEEVARASLALWDRLFAMRRRKRRKTEDYDADGHEEAERIGIAVKWPEDRRLGKGKGRSLVVWLTRAGEEVRTLTTCSVLKVLTTFTSRTGHPTNITSFHCISLLISSRRTLQPPSPPKSISRNLSSCPWRFCNR